MKNILYKALFIISILLVIVFVIVLNIDWLNYYEYMSAPFYVYIIVRAFEFIFPAIICFVVSMLLRKKEANRDEIDKAKK